MYFYPNQSGNLGEELTSCNTDTECPKGMYCTSLGYCIADTCKTNADCDPTRACFGGLCVSKKNLPAGNECEIDYDCQEIPMTGPPGSKICLDGYCVDGVHGIFDPATICSLSGGTYNVTTGQCVKDGTVINTEPPIEPDNTQPDNTQPDNTQPPVKKQPPSDLSKTSETNGQSQESSFPWGWALGIALLTAGGAVGIHYLKQKK
jgi:hypothetical protein